MRLMLWRGRYVPIPKHVAYTDDATIQQAMIKKYDKTETDIKQITARSKSGQTKKN